MENKTLTIDISKLPIVIEVITDNIKKEYVIKPNKERTGIFLNKKEIYYDKYIPKGNKTFY